jgi:SAM-dependent methyltransferase
MNDTQSLADIVVRALPPEPWAEGDNIPWDDPAFSARMLQEHLTQAHDLASRRAAKIDAQIAWIYAHLLRSAPARILDLACGPGLYAMRLARLGCTCLGIDFGPASVAYAREQSQGLACEYVLDDIRQADYRGPHDLALLVYGQFNVFRPDEARDILARAWDALRPGGLLLLEPHTWAAVQESAGAPGWSAAAAGLFASEPHLLLSESFWDERRAASTERFYVIAAATGEVTRYALSMQAYRDDDYVAVLHEAGYADVVFYPSLTGEPDDSQTGLLAISARRPA